MGTITIHPPESRPEPGRSRTRVVVAFVLGLLLALACFAFWMYSSYQEKKDLQTRLEREKRRTADLIARTAETDQKLAAMSTDLNVVTNKLNVTSGNLKAARSQARILKNGQLSQASNHRTFSDPVWNAWSEPFSADKILFAPQKLQPGRDYSFVLNLSALSFDQDKSAKDSGVYSQQADSSFLDWVNKNPQLDSRDVQVLVIPDRAYFESQLEGQVMRSFTIELAKMRRVHGTGFALSGSALKYLQAHNGTADFNFGIKSFHIKTSSKLGLGSIAVSIWADGMPVNEISYSVCIVRELTDACDYAQQPVYSLKGVDLTKLDRPPDAALQIIDRQLDVVGLFRCNICGWKDNEYRIWSVAETEKDFAEEVKKIVRRLGKVPKLPSEEAYSQRFRTASEALYNVLFGGGALNRPSSDDEQAQATAAMTALNDFVSKSRSQMLLNKPPLSLFVRLIPSEHDLVLTPIALLEFKTPQLSVPGVTTQSLYPNFIGFYVDVQAPLELQDYSRNASCLSQWVLFVPPPQAPDGLVGEYQDVEDARSAFEKWINIFQDSCGDCVKQDSNLESFHTWLKGNDAHAGAIVALSHHDDSFGLYFDSTNQDPAIITSDIKRVFNEPTVAILAACGTAEPGGSDFITKFNSHKVRTVIATSSAVDGGMAGTFLSFLVENLEQNRDSSTYALSQARFDAVRRLSSQKDASMVPYGARALEFILAGNGSIRLCPPADTKSTGNSP